MAAPEDVNTLNFTGKYVMNKALSDTKEADEILRLQGVSWWTRTAISAATITLHVKHYKGDDGEEHIDVQQFLTGGISSSPEERTLDWQMRDRYDRIFGYVAGRSKRISVDDVEEEFLKKEWLPDTQEMGLLFSYVESDAPKSKTTWVALQTWGLKKSAMRGDTLVMCVSPAQKARSSRGG